jgi:hypothetical protein
LNGSRATSFLPWRITRPSATIACAEDKNANQEEQVQCASESGPVDGEELLGSEELKRQYREAQERLQSAPPTADR